jgi:hypothetical protein
MARRISSAAVSILISYTILVKRIVRIVPAKCSLLHGLALVASSLVSIKQYLKGRMKRHRKEKL